MKKNLLITLFLVLGFLGGSCSDSSSTDDGDTGNTGGGDPTVKIEVSNIADNKATVTATLVSGDFHGAKIITGIRVSSLDFDYTREIQLIKYVEENGSKVDGLPYTTELSDLIFEQDYLCAVIVYDATGRACSSSYTTFTADGVPDGISDENSAGNLEDNPQQ
ncbi:hypothetical protein [Alistipes sp.]|uniref:hypothetical protein n=1 Tax=Alistipes sp. TaxID=1872444 RepID=UPI003A845321